MITSHWRPLLFPATLPRLCVLLCVLQNCQGLRISSSSSTLFLNDVSLRRSSEQTSTTTTSRVKFASWNSNNNSYNNVVYSRDNMRLMLSSIPDDDNNRKQALTTNAKDVDILGNAIKKITKSLPPAPENFLVLGGDVAALFVYSFLDHSMNNAYAAALAKQTAEKIVGLHAAWIDSFHMPSSFIVATQNYYMAEASDNLTMYSPALDYAGVCSVLFASCWLISGYFHQAFSYDNTVQCKPATAVILAGRTWIFAACAMLAIAFYSDLFVSDLQYQVGGVTHTDVEYIFDSLAVIVSWRFMIASILGRY